MSLADAYPHLRSRYTRVLLRKGGFDKADQVLLRDHLIEAGFEARILNKNKKTVLYAPALELWLELGERYWAVETRRLRVLDQEVDLAFHAIIQRHKGSKMRPAKARCSDCYACCNPPDAWLVQPQQSRSCRLSQRLHPSKHRVSSAPVEDPVYIYQAPRGDAGSPKGPP